ncbi:MAG: acetyltransferase [Gammaproteobacteria bacterium]|nr:acetyltransferase [Gammaproteobacteria bacterium]MDE0286142.1 acetyltransferase [Gammaproteobacteria bacterium]MDE0513197.1 acetyltransferase [Gammaproteobacteria bacterium]
MSSLLIFGAGGHGKVVADTARAIGNWNEIMFADDAYPQVTSVDGYPVVADFLSARSMGNDHGDVIVAIGDNRKRSDLTAQLRQSGFNPVTLVHPTAVVAGSAHIEEGTVIFAQAVVQAAARIARAVIVNTAATVDHDCVIGDGVHLSPGVHLGGEVEIGDYSWLGVGAVVINRTAVGSGVTVGAGSCVIGDLSDGVTAVGIPARPVRQPQPGD